MTGKLSLLAFLTVAATFPSCGGRAVDMGGVDQGTGGNAGTASGGAGGTGGSHSNGGTGGSGGMGGSPSTGGTGGSPSTGGAGGHGGTSTGGVGNSGGTGGSGGTSSTGGSGGKVEVTCGGISCTDNDICCFTTGQCFDPATSPGACPKPLEVQWCNGPSSEPCGSNADCAWDEYCSPRVACTGPGCCLKKTNCPHAGAACGCDGQAYDDSATACTAGVPALVAQCGTSFPSYPPSPAVCGSLSAWCPQGQQCCPVTGYCYDASKPELCSTAKPGAAFPCYQVSDCPVSELALSFACLEPSCGALGYCGTGPDCDSTVLDPVCGCDGKTYVNAQCAEGHSVPVDHAGQCGDAGL